MQARHRDAGRFAEPVGGLPHGHSGAAAERAGLGALAAAVAAIAGILLAPITFVHANMGRIGLKAFPAAVVGGFGRLPGAIVGGLVIGVVESLSGFYLPEGFKDIAPYIVVLLMLTTRPTGLFGDKLSKKVGIFSASFCDALCLQEPVRAAHRARAAQRARVLVRPARRAAGGSSLADRGVLARATGLHADLRHRGQGLMLPAGFTGQFSIGHAPFLGTRAYTQALHRAALGRPRGAPIPRAPWSSRHFGSAPERNEVLLRHRQRAMLRLSALLRRRARTHSRSRVHRVFT